MRKGQAVSGIKGWQETIQNDGIWLVARTTENKNKSWGVFDGSLSAGIIATIPVYFREASRYITQQI